MSLWTPTFELARVTLEFTSPFRIGAGGWDPLVDAFFATDANGLPALPGTSIAGVLRHAATDAWGKEAAERIFGFQERNDGRASCLRVSWGQVHGQDNQPVPFRGANLDDPVLAALAAGVVRDHVRIDVRGTADDAGKFDEQVAPAGARFTFELVMLEGSGVTLADILGLLRSPSVRLGSGGRKGLGRFEMRAKGAGFDLRDSKSRALFETLPTGLHEAVPEGLLAEITPEPPASSQRWRTGTLELQPVDYWIFGGGDPWREPEHRRQQGGEEWINMVPVEMRRVEWTSGKGVVTDPVPVVPGSSVKGALRHRVEFHARRRARRFCDVSSDAVGQVGSELDRSVSALFGRIKGRESDDDGRPGRLLIADGRARDFAWGRLDHVSLDRFTQGPLDRALFGEAPLFGGTIELDVALDVGVGDDRVSDDALRALEEAFQDLCSERLAIGAGANRGHGFCLGTLTWDGGASPWA